MQLPAQTLEQKSTIDIWPDVHWHKYKRQRAFTASHTDGLGEHAQNGVTAYIPFQKENPIL